MSEVYAIIPARGGSKGIPKKNVKMLNGKPLIAYTIEHALKSKKISRVYVSTDDNEIAKISLKHGALPIMRPEDLSTDTASSESAVIHALKALSPIPPITVFLQCTSPIRYTSDIDDAIEKVESGEYDSVFSANKSFINVWEKRAFGMHSITYNYRERTMRQERPEQFNENGSFYVFKSDIFLKEMNRNCGRIGIQEVPVACSFEIDNVFDFWLCEEIIKKLEGVCRER